MLIPNFVFDVSWIKEALKTTSEPVPQVDGIATTGIGRLYFIGKPLNDIGFLFKFLSSSAIPFA